MTILKSCIVAFTICTAINNVANGEVFKIQGLGGVKGLNGHKFQATPPQAKPSQVETDVFMVAHNRSKCNIRVAVRYLATNKKWTTSKWLVLKPGEAKAVAKSANTLAYVYAESIGSPSVIWSGKDKSYTVENSNRKYGFRVRHRRPKDMVFSIPFTVSAG